MTQAIKLLLITTLITTTLAVDKLTSERKAEFEKALGEAIKSLETKQAELAKIQLNIDNVPIVKARIGEIQESLKVLQAERQTLQKEYMTLRTEEIEKPIIHKKLKEELEDHTKIIWLTRFKKIEQAIHFAENSDVVALSKSFKTTYDQTAEIHAAKTKILKIEEDIANLSTLQKKLKTLQAEKLILDSVYDKAKTNMDEKKNTYEEAVAKCKKFLGEFEESGLEKAAIALNEANFELNEAWKKQDNIDNEIREKNLQINNNLEETDDALEKVDEQVHSILLKIFEIYGITQYSDWRLAFVTHISNLSKNTVLLTKKYELLTKLLSHDAEVKYHSIVSDLNSKLDRFKLQQKQEDEQKEFRTSVIDLVTHKAVLDAGKTLFIQATRDWKIAEDLYLVIKDEEKKDLVQKVTSSLKSLGIAIDNYSNETLIHLDLKEKEKTSERLYEIARNKIYFLSLALSELYKLMDEAWTVDDLNKKNTDLIKRYGVVFNEVLKTEDFITELEEIGVKAQSSNTWKWVTGSILFAALCAIKYKLDH